jgi:hypothetical protein
MGSRTRQEMVLEIYDREAMGEVTESEIRIIQKGLLDAFGEGGLLSPGEIARVLLEEKLPVRFDQVLRMGHLHDRYEEMFAGLAFPANLVQAAESLQKIDARYREFRQQGDRTGIRYARQTALRARQNALALSRTPERRQINLEIAQWFSIWLQTPDIFQSWLEIRQRQPEFRQLLEPLGERT